VSSSKSNWPLSTGFPQDQGNTAAFFEFDGSNGEIGSALYAVNTSSNSNAATFYNTNVNNLVNPAVYAQSVSYEASGVIGEIGPDSSTTVVTGVAVGGLDETTQGAVGVYGSSSHGKAADFRVGGADCYFAKSSNWSCSSDRNLKEDFRAVDAKATLQGIVRLPVWNYRFKAQTDPNRRSVGPTAQDFRAAFGLGDDDKHINTGDEMGVTLAAIQGLHQEITERDAEIAALRADNATMKRQLAERDATTINRVARLEAAVARLAQGTRGTKEASLTEH
jgi:hypothetical protein